MWVSAIATILSVVLQLQTAKNEIEFKLVSNELLTRPIRVDGLESSYSYNGEDIDKLWQIRFILTNAGSNPIIGSGERSHLINNNLSLSLSSDFKILEQTVSSDAFKLDGSDKVLRLTFMQWKPNEAFEIMLYLSQVKGESAPLVSLDEREIVDGQVTVTSLIEQDTAGTYLYEYLPSPLTTFLKWFVVISFGLLLFIMPFVIVSTVKENSKYKKWFNSSKEELEQFIRTNPNNPKDLRDWKDKHWKSSGEDKPSIVPSNKTKDMVIGTIAIYIFFGVPLLFMISH